MDAKEELKRRRKMAQHENKNALKHGLFAEAVILPGENEEEFKALHDSVVEEWNPEGPIEEDAAMNITNVLWRKRRFERFRKKKVEVILEKQADNKKQRAREDEKMKEIVAALNSG